MKKHLFALGAASVIALGAMSGSVFATDVTGESGTADAVHTVGKSYIINIPGKITLAKSGNSATYTANVSASNLGIDVFFEEQNIHTISAEGELMLTVLASFAQAESLSVSENQKWRVKKNFEEGKPWNGTMLGYRYKDGTLIVHEGEAETVRRIFQEYLDGKGTTAIANGLNADGIPTRFGNGWSKSTVSKVLRNYAYTGNLLLQQTFRENHLTKKTLVNEGQLPKYHAESTHEAIIPLETFQTVQNEIERRAELYKPKPPEKPS